MAKEIFHSQQTINTASTLISIALDTSTEKIRGINDIDDEFTRSLVTEGVHKHLDTANSDYTTVINSSVAGASTWDFVNSNLTKLSAPNTQGAPLLTSALKKAGNSIKFLKGGMEQGIKTITVIPLIATAAAAGTTLAVKAYQKNKRNNKKIILKRLATKAHRDLKVHLTHSSTLDSVFAKQLLQSLDYLIHDLEIDLKIA
jgi:hypothetical protein